jgi:hypothetical protein
MARKAYDDQILKLAARLEPEADTVVRGRGKRSKLYRWLFVRADDFQIMLEEHQPSWTSVAKALIETEDARDGFGKPPSPERVRKAWLDVRQAKGWSTKASARERSAATPPPAPVLSPSPTEAKRTFGTATLRGHDPTKKPPPSVPVVTPERPPPTDPDKLLADFIGKPTTGSRFTPKRD